MNKKVLNVGGSTKMIDIPAIYSGWDHLLLDIVDGPDVDYVMDTRDMEFNSEFDAIYLSHNLEHYASKDVPLVLSKFRHAIKQGGHVHIRVPNLGLVIKLIAEHSSDLQQPLYDTPSGPVTAQDIIYGSPRGTDREHDDFHIHRTGFTAASLERALEVAGFDSISVEEEGFDLVAIGWVEEVDLSLRRMVIRPSLTEGSVTIVFAHNGTMRFEFYRSLVALKQYDFSNAKHIIGESSAGGPYIVQNRNTMIEQALELGSEWILSLDNDVVFSADILDRLLEVADPVERPIMGALYFTTLDEKWFPVWLEKDEKGDDIPVEFITIGDVRELSVVGMGCTLIHRSVLEKMRNSTDDQWPWFGHDLINGTRRGEDVTFCYRARDLGFLTYGFAYPLVHMKTYPIDWRTFHDQYRLLELGMKPQ